MDDKTERTFHAAIIRLYRRLLPIAADQHLSDDAILSQVLLPSPSELLRRARLRYVATLLHCGERQEWTLLVEDDMHWLWCQLRNCSSLQDPQEHWPQWVDIIVHHRSYWRKLVRRAMEHAIGQRRNAWHVQEFYNNILNELRSFLNYVPHSSHKTTDSVGFLDAFIAGRFARMVLEKPHICLKSMDTLQCVAR